MAVPSLTISATGVSSPDYPTILEALTADFQSIYGSDAVLDPDSQDGQLLAIFAKAIYDCQQNVVAVYNSFSPTNAQGVGLSSLVKINGLARLVASYSTVTLTLTGVAGTVINNGVVGDDLSMNTRWALPASVTIPVGGSIVVTATSTDLGSVSAAVGTLVVILTPTAGWQTVTNTAAAVPGAPVESDAALRQRQSLSTGLPALTTLSSIYAAVAALPGVQRLAVYENDTDSADANGITAHSVSVVTLGGDATSIARAIASKKSPGTGTYGSTSVSVTDSHGVVDTIKFYALSVAQLDVTVTVKALAGYQSTTATLIQQAVANFVNSLDIGEDSYYLRLVAPANLEGDNAVNGTGLTEAQLDVLSGTFTVTAVTQARHGNAKSAQDIVIAFNEAAALDTTNITITVI